LGGLVYLAELEDAIVVDMNRNSKLVTKIKIDNEDYCFRQTMEFYLGEKENFIVRDYDSQM